MENKDTSPPNVLTAPLADAAAISRELLAPRESRFQNGWIFVFFVLIFIAAQITLLVRSTAGIYVNAMVFVALIALGLWKEKYRQLAISAALLPVATMVSLSLPQTTVLAQTTVFYVSLLVLALLYRYLFSLDEPLQNSRLKLKGYGYVLPLMLILGQLLGVIGYLLLRHHYNFAHTSLPLVAVISVVFAIAEESYFRGLIQQRGGHLFNAGLATLLSVVFYTFSSVGHVTILIPLFAALSGIVLSIVYYKKQNLLLTTTLNAAMKLTYIGLLAGFIFR